MATTRTAARPAARKATKAARPARAAKVAAQPKTSTTLRFSGVLKGVSQQAAHLTTKKGSYNSSRGAYDKDEQVLSGGELVVQVIVPRPQLPEKPAEPQSLRSARQTLSYNAAPRTPQPVEVVPEKNAGETDAAYAKRKATAHKDFEQRAQQWDASMKAHTNAEERVAREVSQYQGMVARWNEQRANMAALFNGYAQISAAGALMSGMPIEVELKPTASWIRKFLPGFNPAALALTDSRVALAAPLEEEPLQLAGPADDDEDEDD